MNARIYQIVNLLANNIPDWTVGATGRKHQVRS